MQKQKHMKKYLLIALTLLTAVIVHAETVSFYAVEWAAAQSLSDGSPVSTYTQAGVSVTFAQGDAISAPSYNAQYSALVTNMGNTMTVAVPEGKRLSQAVFTMYNNTMAGRLKQAAWSGGTVDSEGAVVTWTGNEDSVTVTFSNMVGFVEFSFTFAEPPADPELSYNDTTTLDIAAYTAQWIEDHPWDEWPSGEVDEVSFAVDNKTVVIQRDAEEDPLFIEEDNVELVTGSTMTITAPYKIRKIIFSFTDYHGRRWAMFENRSTCSSGELTNDKSDQTTAVWTGNTAQLTITTGSYAANLTKMVIICDSTDNKVAVTFYDANGNVLKIDSVVLGQNAIAPAIEDSCFAGWDKDLTNVRENMDVHPLSTDLLFFTIDEWKDLYGTWRVPQAAKGDYTIYSEYYEGGGVGEDPIVIDGVEYRNRLLIYSGYQYIKAAQPFNNLTFVCRYDVSAANLAAATWSSGEVTQDGLYVHWTGYTDSLRWDLPDASYQICAYRIVCRELTEYTVIFYDIDGNELKREVVARGESATAPTDMEQTGYTFVGWDTDFTNLGGENPLIYVHPIYEEAEGYVLVKFVDVNGNVLQQSRVLIGDSVTPPEAPALPFMKFVGWDHELTNITEPVTIKPIYEFDSNSPDILTMEQWRTISPQEGEYYAVKGIVTRNYSSELEEGGTLSFAISDDVTSTAFGAELNVIHSLNLNSAPFFHKAQVQPGDTLVAYGQWKAERFNGSGSDVWGIYYGYLLYHSTPTDRSNVFYLEMPSVEGLYDFNGDGNKQVTKTSSSSEWDSNTGINTTDFALLTTNSFSEGFWISDTLIHIHQEGGYGEVKTFGNDILSIEDVDGDSQADATLGTQANTNLVGQTQLLMSKNGSYSIVDSAFAITNMDLNRDGRIDYLILRNNGPEGAAYGEIAYQAADGSFGIEKMNFVNSTISFAPMVHRVKGANRILSAPTTAVDLNNDNLMDLVDERDGVLYINRGNGQWEWKEMGASVILTDLNNDGYTDFVMPSDKLYTAIYNPVTQDYTITTINSTGMVDDVVYCKDFDGDGDIDLLATFSAFYNAQIAYTAFFINDGTGHFTRQNEQNYGPNELWFSDCQDLDGDGYYDLLAFQGTIGIHTCKACYNYWGAFDTLAGVFWLKGNANGYYAEPEKLIGAEGDFNSNDKLCFGFPDIGRKPSPSDYPRNTMKFHIYAEDIDGNGTMRVWAPGLTDNGTTVLFPVEAVAPNTRPTAPAVPQLTYASGLLTITWGDGADDKTKTADLTYALRIGTTAGGNDILAAHANADGSRRNFMDGNMGRAHSYTIDLRTYAPGTVYVAVQTIDAQHAGSEWSQEASIAHTFVPVDFTFAKNPIAFNETAEVHYTALPEGYTHTWRVADGQVVTDTTCLALTFPTGGEKTITHIVTAPNGTRDSISHVLTVLPAAVSAPVEATIDVRNILARPLADYTFDGRMDGVKDVVYEGVANETFFQKALGMWNANTLSLDEVRWYDYDHDGNIDLLFNTPRFDYIYMPHDPVQPALTDPITTELTDYNRLVYILGYGYTQYTTYNYFSFKEDMRHIGFEECALSTLSGDEKTRTLEIADFSREGVVEYKPVTIMGDEEQFKALVATSFITADFDHDGFTDIAGLGKSDYSVTSVAYPELSIFYNRGNKVYEQGNIPFPEALPPYTTASLTDFNGDGYIDVLIYHNDTWDSNDVKFGRIYWNNANLSFTPMDLPNLNMVYDNPNIITDVDNNGYKDVVAITENSALGNRSIYVWYMGAEGLQNHGSLAAVSTSTYNLQDIYLAPNDHRLMCGEHLYPIIAQADERPAAPTNIQATMTDEGLLLTWDAAVDDHTPAALMRYNLSMKLQGAETYLFSPQNGGNADAAYVPGYHYINATQYLIPTSVLTNGTYEIRMQAVDNQNKMSLFTETLLVPVARNPIEAPATTCAFDFTDISYQGAESAGTPVWDFGTDAVIHSGSGFGPYIVYWQSGGEKVIRLTLADTTYVDTITVNDPYELAIYPPQELYENIPVTVDLPAGVTCAWYAKLNDDTEWHPVDRTGILTDASYVLIYDRRLKAEGATITAYTVDGKPSLCDEKLEIRFVFYTPEGCSGYYEYVVTVRRQTNIPTLSLVTTGVDGHNVISWSNVDAFSTINVYREGNSLNDFQLIGSVTADAGSFIDANSDATQKAERYYITGVSTSGESPASTIHRTVHLTISRGVADGTYNLIWNDYAGTPVTGYRILRGAAPASLTEIATLASSNNSYTDQAPVATLPYYAIEYVLSAPANAPARVKRATADGNTALVGRSNVVNREDIDEQDITNIQAGEAPYTKVLRDGVLYLLRGDKTYTVTGQEVK